MNDIDELLSVVENPTRRRILESLVRSPSYPLQLSKELGISQQAVMKNLVIMEQNGLVVSYRENSTLGPMRTVYTPSTEFTVVIDLHAGMFSARILEPPQQSGEADTDDLEEALGRIQDIDARIRELEDERTTLLQERNGLVSRVRSLTEYPEAGDPDRIQAILGGNMKKEGRNRYGER
ncbi:MAG: helix-turn-helix domain-containing protein [Candidatus Methanomethylophilaceae archaeon]|nr:helix-turn-helix domain-containing protein [Candidatus Methanomethylophilaceae archaeon]